MDAGIVNAFPLEDAIAAGCTDILVLLTRPCGYRRKTPGAATRWLFKHHCAHGNTDLMRAFDHYVQRDTAVRDLAFGRVPLPTQVNIATICTDAIDRYHSVMDDMRARYGAIDDARGTAYVESIFHGATTDWIKDGTPDMRRQWHNLKYYTWV